ncbi:MAG: response regulator transcription factor [Spirochaetota bacterium]|nr:response regulator transcription factor [Spirochaetota bacterium]
MKRVFVVDDEEEILEILTINLKAEGYDVKDFPSGNKLINYLLNSPEKPHLIILDIMMEGINGYDTCRKIRSDSRFQHIPVIFLSAKSSEDSKILGLEYGGDDYITKPFSIKELLLRVNAVLKRTEPPSEKPNTSYHYGKLSLTKETHQAVLSNEPLSLTKTEFSLLILFMENPSRYFSREEILRFVWPDDSEISERSVDVHIRRLRAKLKDHKDLIRTYSGVGYGFFPKN